jgi:hypothetical protein
MMTDPAFRVVVAIAAMNASVAAGSAPLAAAATRDTGTMVAEQRLPQAGFDRGRIQFAAGTNSASVSDTVARGDWHHWAVRARRGQFIHVTATEPAGNATFELYTPSGNQMANDVRSFSRQLPDTGDYAIDIGSAGGVANYTLTVAIRNVPIAPLPPRDGHFRDQIQFAPGTDRGSVAGVVVRSDWDEWTFRAARGQHLRLTLSSVIDNATLRLYTPNGDPLAFDRTSFVGRLPANGLYTIEVGPTAGWATYRLNLRITDAPPQSPPPPPASAPSEAERITFAVGTNNASVTGDVLPATTDRYVLRASAGQVMVAHVDSVADNVFLSIFAPDGTARTEHVLRDAVELPIAGDYIIVVSTTSSGGPYRLSVWIA